MKAPEAITTKRLLLRKPAVEDASDIFERYAADAEVTRYLAWPIHTSVDDTRAFLEFGDAEWEQWPAIPDLFACRWPPDLHPGVAEDVVSYAWIAPAD